MAKEIALKLKITSQGEEKVISNISELETELQKLQTTLKTLDFGSAAFKEATANISKLRTKIDEIDKASEGIGAEKKFRAFGDAINILTGSFQVASGALGLFISDEKSLEQVQQAEAAALNVLNVALGINAINTALVESATLRKTIADKASALATRAAAIAQAAYNAVLNANPIVLFITALTALTGAIYLLVKATDEDTDAQGQSNLQKKKALEIDTELAAVQKKAATELKVQTTILTDNVATRNLELKTLEDLKKTYPGFNAFIDKNNTLTKEGIKFLGLQIALQEKQATLQALRTKKIDLEIKANQNLTDEIANQGTIIGKTTTKITQFFKGNFTDISAFGGALQDAVKDEAAGLQVVNTRIDEQTKEVDKLLGQLNPLNNTLNKTAAAEANAAKATKTTSEIVDRRTASLIQLNKVLDVELAKLQELQKEQLSFSSNVLQKEDEIIGRQKEQLGNLTNALATEAKKLSIELNKLLRETIPSEAEAVEIEDGYIKLFNTISKLYTTGAIDLQDKLGFEDFVAEAEKVIPKLGEQLKLVGEDGKKSFVEFYNEIKYRVKNIQDIQKTLKITPGSDLETTKKLSLLEDKIYQLRVDRIKTGESETSIREQSIALIQSELGFTDKLNTLNANIALQQTKVSKAKDKDKSVQEGRLAQLVKEKDAIDKITESLLTGIIRSADFFDVANKINVEADKKGEEIKKNLAERRRTFTKEELEGLKEYFKANAGQFSTLFTDIFTNIDDYISKVGKDGVKELIGSIESGFTDIDSLTRAQLEKLQAYLKVASAELASSLGEDGGVLNNILDKISKKLKELPTEAEESFTKSIDGFKKVADQVLSAFTQISSQFSNVVQLQNSLLLEQLQYQQDTALKLIGEANTENAAENERIAAERLAVEKDFQKKKFDIEKKARIQELQFQLANALAATAQGIITALATPPLGVGIALAAILAGLAGAQVAVIKDQIDFTQNKAYLGRTGGLVEGSSHDTYGGGVPTMLEGGEFILNKEAVRAYGDTISSINTATGGKPMSIDDSRIVQAISKQNLSTKQPLKAYVLYNDIQDTTKLNNKITQLARL
jgi:hypothetical protein